MKENSVQPGFDLRVLLAEDHPVNLKVAVRYMERIGLEVEAVCNGREALKTLRAGGFDAVFLDIEMPVMDGMEACCRIREAAFPGVPADIPVIAMTAHTDEEALARMYGAGFTRVLLKPINPGALCEVMEEVFRMKPQKNGNVTEDEPMTNEQIKRSHSSAFPAGEVRDDFNRCIVDLNALARRYGDDIEFMKELLTAFLQEIPARRDKLEDAFAKKDYPALSKLSHSLKGTAGTVRADGLAELSASLDMAGRKLDAQSMISFFPRVMEELGKVEDFLKNYLQSP